MCRSQTTITVIRLRTTMAPMAPQTIARFCSAGGRLRAARAMTIALSPASTRSITTMASSAERKVAGSIEATLAWGAFDFAERRHGRDSRFAMHRESRSIGAARETGAPSGLCAACHNRRTRGSPGSGVQSGSSPRPGLRDVRFVVNTGREAPALRVPSGTSETFAFPPTGTAMTTPLALPALRRYLRHGTLPQLAAFEAVVRLGSATRAAQALCVAQPTISGHLKKLGDALGVRLFVLQGKRLVP